MNRLGFSETPAPEAGHEPARPAMRQRILQRDRRRVAIRLEEEYWVQLEDCAREEGRRLSDLVFEAMGAAGEAVNRTALLRVYCLRWLRRRLEQAKRAAQPRAHPDLQVILSACPTPCVIMTRDKAIIAYNTAFARSIVAGLAPTGGEADKSRPLTFRLDTPLETIHADLLSGKARFREAKAEFVRRDRTIHAVARFCLLSAEKTANAPLLCFLAGDGDDGIAAAPS